jgi:hypothetical protein
LNNLRANRERGQYSGSAVLPGAEVAIQSNLWLDPNARTWRATYDIMLGAALVDNTAGVIVKSQ